MFLYTEGFGWGAVSLLCVLGIIRLSTRCDASRLVESHSGKFAEVEISKCLSYRLHVRQSWEDGKVIFVKNGRKKLERWDKTTGISEERGRKMMGIKEWSEEWVGDKTNSMPLYVLYFIVIFRIPTLTRTQVHILWCFDPITETKVDRK